MRPNFIQTKNTKRFMDGMDKLHNRGASEACFMVIDGKPGLGKTRTLDWWAARNDSIFIRAKKEWTPNWMLGDLLEAMNAVPEYSFKKMFKQVLNGLRTRYVQAQREGGTLAIVVDEADYITRKTNLIDTLRDLTDHLEIPVILVGMGSVRKNLIKSPQTASRVGQYVEFLPLGFDDCKSLINGLSQVEAADDLIGFTEKMSAGYSREMKEAIVSIESFGVENNLDIVKLKDMAGEFLMNDRATGTPIFIPEDV